MLIHASNYQGLVTGMFILIGLFVAGLLAVVSRGIAAGTTAIAEPSATFSLIEGRLIGGLRIAAALAFFGSLAQACSAWSISPECGWVLQGSFLALVAIPMFVESARAWRGRELNLYGPFSPSQLRGFGVIHALLAATVTVAGCIFIGSSTSLVPLGVSTGAFFIYLWLRLILEIVKRVT